MTVTRIYSKRGSQLTEVGETQPTGDEMVNNVVLLYHLAAHRNLNMLIVQLPTYPPTHVQVVVIHPPTHTLYII